MGAFFMFHNEADIDRKSVARVFKDKGFHEPSEYDLGDAKLWLYRKQFIDLDSKWESPQGTRLFLTGTLVYKSQNYQQSANQLLNDYDKNRIEYNECIGAFSAIFVRNGRIEILTDYNCLYSVFLDVQNNVVSSSFLAVLESNLSKWKINRLACLENLLCGRIAAPNTMIEGIFRTDRKFQIENKSSWFGFIELPYEIEDSVPTSIENCVDNQILQLKNRFLSISSFADEFKVDIGISGGYDSRLLMLLAQNLPSGFTAHTHVKHNDDGDLEVAKVLSKEFAVPLTMIKTKHPLEMSETEFNANLDDALFFFDGRVNTSMGWLRYEYTRDYRRKVLHDRRLTLSGVGGEIFRNYNYSPIHRTQLRSWVAYYAIGYQMLAVINTKKECSDFVAYISDIIARKLDLDPGRKGSIDFTAARRYYTDIVLPDWHGLKNSAENQIAFYLSPFADRQVLENALAVTKHIGVYGVFEAAMINKLNKKIAQIPSAYGHNFSKIPARFVVRAGIRSLLPNNIKLGLGFWKSKLSKNNQNISDKYIEKHTILKSAMNRIEQLDLPINWELYLNNSTNIDLMLSMGCIIDRFAHKLEL